MKYVSTRNGKNKIESAEAIKLGIAPDGGLFVPCETAKLTQDEIKSFVDMKYNDIALKILEKYLCDYTKDELKYCIEKAYTKEKFESEKIAPLKKINEDVSVLELWHGPTCAFKDMALQILPRFLVKAVEKTNEEGEIVILVATSGDTGKAALEGFKDVKGTRVIVFYPKDGVSQVQKMQMVTQEGGNLSAVAVDGNFDDAQTGVKEIFGNEQFESQIKKSGFKLSSANSINWGRLAPQIVYYFSSYAEMVKKGDIKFGDKINYVVPTGNFGNILACYYASNMGLPVNKLIVASNDNNILTDFINTGEYNTRRDFKKTMSPSMDILISSNLERLLFEILNKDSETLNNWMKELKEQGVYKVDLKTLEKIKESFWSNTCNEYETLNTINSVYNKYKYVLDTHTAVAMNVYDKYRNMTEDKTKTIVVSTASPFKFSDSVMKAIFGESEIAGKTEFDLLEELYSKCNLNIPESLNKIAEKEIKHKIKCGKTGMLNCVEEILKK